MLKVLVIDDDKFFRNMFSSELAQENITVETAADGAEGLTKAKEMRPDAVILDLILPKGDGYELIGALKGSPETKDTAIIVFSGLSQEHDRDEALALGVAAYFFKERHTVRQVVEAIRAHTKTAA